MAHQFGYVDQISPAVGTDGAFEALYQNRDHAQLINSREGLVDAWTRDGRVFIAHNPVIGTPETMSATGTAITLTAPSLRYTIPSGVIVVPISASIASITVNAKKVVFGVIVNNADSYTTGGDTVPMLCKNALINGTTELRATGVTNLHYSDAAITEAALTNPRLLKILKKAGTATDETTWNPEYNILKGDPMVYLVGPASFLVFDVQETAADEAEFVMTWAELQADTVP